MGLLDNIGVMELSAALLIGWGALFCFLGQPLFKALLRALGALAGAFGGLWLASEYFPTLEWALWVLPIVLGLAGLALVWYAFMVGVFLAGAGFGAALGEAILQPVEMTQTETVILLATAALGGVLAVLLQRVFLTLATAALGAWAVIAGVLFFIRPPAEEILASEDPLVLLDPPLTLFFLISWGLLGVLGLVVQLRNPRKQREKKKEEGD